jgi:type II secretory pathway component GspD/PulD (secretin)
MKKSLILFTILIAPFCSNADTITTEHDQPQANTWPITTLLKHLAEKENHNLIVMPSVQGIVSLYLQHFQPSAIIKALAKHHLIALEEDHGVWIADSAPPTLLTFTPKHRPMSDYQALIAILSKQLKTPNFAHIDDKLNAIFISAPHNMAQEISRTLNALDGSTELYHIQTHLIIVNQSLIKHEDPIHPGLWSPSAWFTHHHLSELFQTQADTNKSGLINWALHHLEQQGQLKILAEPDLWITDHETVELASGTDIPIITKTSRGSQAVTYRPCYLTLKLTPHQINHKQMQISMQLSYTNPQSSATPNDPPILIHHGLTHRAILPMGQPYIMGALSIHKKTMTDQQHSWIKHIPLVNYFFQGKHLDQAQQQLVVIIQVFPQK